MLLSLTASSYLLNFILMIKIILENELTHQTALNTILSLAKYLYKIEKMKKNIGISDRLIRFVLMDLLLGASYYGISLPLFWANLTFIISLGLIFTILIPYSPIYHLLGISTREN